jgi:hypothetical protein
MVAGIPPTSIRRPAHDGRDLLFGHSFVKALKVCWSNAGAWYTKLHHDKRSE